MNIGENIKKIRKEKGLTQKSLGERCGVNEVQIRRYELGNAIPHLETIKKIATALEVSEYELQGISITEIMKTLSTTTSFYNYLLSIGYEISDTPYNDRWAIHLKNTDQTLYISNDEMNVLENTTKENIELRINKYLTDGKHNQ